MLQSAFSASSAVRDPVVSTESPIPRRFWIKGILDGAMPMACARPDSVSIQSFPR
jgi:hypothetical protein